MRAIAYGDPLPAGPYSVGLTKHHYTGRTEHARPFTVCGGDGRAIAGHIESRQCAQAIADALNASAPLAYDEDADVDERTEQKDVLTVNECMARLRMSKNAVYAAISSGQIPSIRIGGKILIPRVSLDRMLAPAYDEDADAKGSFDAAVKAIGKRHKQGEPLPRGGYFGGDKE